MNSSDGQLITGLKQSRKTVEVGTSKGLLDALNAMDSV